MSTVQLMLTKFCGTTLYHPKMLRFYLGEFVFREETLRCDKFTLLYYIEIDVFILGIAAVPVHLYPIK